MRDRPNSVARKFEGMKHSERIVIRMPLREIWDSSGVLTTTRTRTLDGSDVAALLRLGTVRFVIAACGDALEWIPQSQCYDFWKNELKPRIVETEAFDLDDFPGAYCYIASEWVDRQTSPIVLLEMYH